MSFENEDGSSPNQVSELLREPQKLKKAKIAYTRDFLLSLSGLDRCKKLPSDLDRSILSDLEAEPYGIQDRHRISGSLPLQGFRHSEYGSSPPTRGGSGNFSRGIYGRWESHSSGRSDRDSDSQSDRDSDSGRHHANQSQRSWQSPEHDGLLGSGSFPRPSYSVGFSAPKVRGNDHYQLNKSNEPYHPPRPYKTLSHSRRETNDSYNDETFGSAECTSQDRAEEERMRRASFELMRKEQCKALQEKQKIGIDSKRDDSLYDVSVILEESKEERKTMDKSTELAVSTTGPVPYTESAKSSLPSQTPASRPLVPPGFRSTGIERNTLVKSSMLNDLTEIGNPDSEESLLHPVRNGTLDNQEERQLTHKMKLNNHPAEDNSEVVELNADKLKGHRIESSQDNSPSILDKIFSSALTMNLGGGSSLNERHGNNQDDTWDAGTVQSSKFAHWFLDEEKRPMDDPSFSRSSELLSLIVGGEKVETPASDGRAVLHVIPEASSPSSELPSSLIATYLPPNTAGISEELYNGVKKDAVPEVLTCEDLEQTILSEYVERSSTSKLPMQGWNLSSVKNEQAKVDANNHASQHLLSLLQKGVGLTSPAEDSRPVDRCQVPGVDSMGTVSGKPRQANGESIQHSGQSLTLETLFGTAFMKELQSAEAPVSVQRGSVSSARGSALESHGTSLSGADDGLFSNTMNESGSNNGSYDGSALISNPSRQMKVEKVDNLLGFDNQIAVDSSQLQNEAVPKHGGLDGPVESQFPEEESLFSVGNPLNPSNSMFMPVGNATKREFLSLNRPIDISENLAALNVAFKNEHSVAGQEGPPLVRNDDLMEPDVAYRNLHAQPSPPQLQPQQINHGRPLYHPLDSHPTAVISQMKFMAPDSFPHHESTPNHQLPSNMLHSSFPHPDKGLQGFDLPAHHSMLQQMQMPGSYPPPHLLHEFRRAGQLPCPSSQAAGFMQEPNSGQVFPFNLRQPNIGGLGMTISASDINSGSNHPEAFQRLMEMELRANAKQIHPFAGGQSQGMYGHELDMGFRYR